MSTEKPANPAKMKLWLRIVLAGSLGLNLAVAGLAVGAAVRFRDGPQMRPGPMFGVMLFRELDRDARRSLRQKAGGEHGSFHDRLRAEGEAILTLLRADPFEPDALAQFIEAQAATGHQFQTVVQRAWVAKVETMTAGERASYADELQGRMRRKSGARSPH